MGCATLEKLKVIVYFVFLKKVYFVVDSVFFNFIFNLGFDLTSADKVSDFLDIFFIGGLLFGICTTIF